MVKRFLARLSMRDTEMKIAGTHHMQYHFQLDGSSYMFVTSSQCDCRRISPLIRCFRCFTIMKEEIFDPLLPIGLNVIIPQGLVLLW